MNIVLNEKAFKLLSIFLFLQRHTGIAQRGTIALSWMIRWVGNRVTSGLLKMTSQKCKAMSKHYFNRIIWKLISDRKRKRNVEQYFSIYFIRSVGLAKGRNGAGGKDRGHPLRSQQGRSDRPHRYHKYWYRCCRSGIRCLLTPGSGMGTKSKSGSGMNIPEYISESLETLFGVKILWSGSGIRNLLDLDPGSGIKKFWSGINIPDPQHCYPMFQLGIFLNWQIYRWRTDTLWIKCPQGDHLTLQAIGYFYIQ